MSKNTKKLVPKLRFSEFQHSGEWEYRGLDPYLRGYSKRMPSNTQVPIYSSTRVGLRPQKDYFDDRELVNDGEYGIVPEEYIVYRHMSDDGAFKFNINKTGGKIAVSKEYPVFTTLDLHSEFLLHLLNESDGFKEFAFAQKKGGTRTRLYLKVLRTWKALLPTYPEQLRIADCLSSIDDLISAQSQKVEALKTHKNGLMQQLFPRDGEAVPRLRFPEFQDAGEWEISSLGDIATITSGGTPNRAKQEYWNGNIPWVTTSLIDFNVIQNANEFISIAGLKESSAKIFPKNTILMAMYGQGITRGKVAVLGIDAATNQACAAILLKRAINTGFVFQNLASRYDEIRKISNPGGQENLSGGLIEKISFSFPDSDAEQQKIADFLSSIDHLINTHSHKLATLKTHKKGLMQQLFPATDEVKT